MLSFALLITFTLPSFASAKEINDAAKQVNELDQTTLDHINEAFHTAIVEKNGKYILDTEKAKEAGLTEKQISNLEEAVKIAPQNELKSLVNGAEIQNPNTVVTFAAGQDDPWGPVKYILYTMIGVTLAETLIADAYHAGMKAACHKLGKNHPSVKKACSFIGYW